MTNISFAVAVLRDADTIVSSSLLDEAEKGPLIAALRATIPPSLNRNYLEILNHSLERLHGIYRPAQARPTPREQNPTEVAQGAGEGTAEAAEGTTSGGEEQAQDAGGVSDDGDGSDGASAEAAAPAQRPKNGKARRQ